MPSHTFLRCGDYLKFLRGLGKFRQKDVPSYTFFFSLWRITWVFEGTWKNFHQKVCPVICFFAVETILSFWWDLESFGKKMWPVTHFFFAVQTILNFLWDLESFHKKVWPVTCFFAVETILSVWGDLESFDKKMWQVTHFFRSADYLKFWMGLRKVSTKIGAQLHVFFAEETNLSFWWDLEKFSQKSVPSHMFLRCEVYLKFLMAFRKISTKMCAQLHVFSLWRLTWVFDGTWKNFHKKVCPITRFFAVETILSFRWDLESFGKKMWPVTHFFRSAENLKSLMGLGKFRQKGLASFTFFSQCRLS